MLHHTKQILIALAVLAAARIGVLAETHSRDAYDGTVRVYIVEPTSRYQDGQLTPYDFGMLDFALVREVVVPDASVWDTTIVWEGIPVGFHDVQQNNIMAIVTVSNVDSTLTDANPPHGYHFYAHYVDATAAASDGSPGRNEVWDDFTHSVFVEEASESG